MPNFKPIVRKDHTCKNGVSRIYIQVPFKGRTERLKTDYYVDPSFMQSNGKIKDIHPLSAKLNLGLTREVMRCYAVFSSGRFNSMNDLMAALRRDESGEGADFFAYAEKRMKELHDEKRFSSEAGYKSMLSSLKDMHRSDTLPFRSIDSSFLSRFKEYLLSHDRSINTVIEYNKKISAIINHAILKNVVDKKNLPSRSINLKAEKPSIRLLGITDIQNILNGVYSPVAQRAVDMFFLSFYLMGLNPKDILYLKRDHIYKGRIIIKRQKTGVPLSIKIPPEASAIINKYKGKKYLLRFLDKDDRFNYYRITTTAANDQLKKVADMVGIDTNLCLKYARSSFATIASSKPLEIPLEVIDIAQGRKIKGETSRYVQYDLDRIDDAQEKVIAIIKGE